MEETTCNKKELFLGHHYLSLYLDFLQDYGSVDCPCRIAWGKEGNLEQASSLTVKWSGYLTCFKYGQEDHQYRDCLQMDYEYVQA